MSCARTEILIGIEGLERLWHSHILIAGLGGVGAIAAETLTRAGVGKITIIDHDDISDTNLNRQIIALHSTIGQPKVKVMQARLTDISPDTEVIPMRAFIRADNLSNFMDTDIDFVLDCIDSIACKSALVAYCLAHHIPVISAMGAGGRLDPTKVCIKSLNQTEEDALAREMRKAMRRLNAPLNFPVVFSSEKSIKAMPHEPTEGNDVCPQGRARAVNGSISYMPNLFGLMMAGFVVQKLTAKI